MGIFHIPNIFLHFTHTKRFWLEFSLYCCSNPLRHTHTNTIMIVYSNIIELILALMRPRTFTTRLDSYECFMYFNTPHLFYTTKTTKSMNFISEYPPLSGNSCIKPEKLLFYLFMRCLWHRIGGGGPSPFKDIINVNRVIFAFYSSDSNRKNN